jgi:hypothetical protein
VHQQITTADPSVAPDGWALHGRVFNADMKPVAGFTVFLVDAAKAYQKAYGFAYTDESGYFLLNYAGPGELSKGRAAVNDTGAAELFVEIGDLKARPVYAGTRPFTPAPGAAVYQNIVLSGTEPLGAPPAGAKRAAPKRKRRN